MGKLEHLAEVFKDTSKVNQEIHLGEPLGSCPDSGGTECLRAPVCGREGRLFNHFSVLTYQSILELFEKGKPEVRVWVEKGKTKSK